MRNSYISSRKLSTLEFADLLNESRYNISNYESGKANIPNRVLIELYKQGINPTWVLTGEQDIYINNQNLHIDDNKMNIHKLNHMPSFSNNNIVENKVQSENFSPEDYEIIARAGNLLLSLADKGNKPA